MPLVQVVYLLVLYVVVNLQAFNTVLVHQVLDNGRDYLFVYLVNTERHVRYIAVLRGPHTGEHVEFYHRTLSQVERFILLNIFGIIELFVPYPCNLLIFQRW